MLRWLISRNEEDLRAWIYAWKLKMLTRQIEAVDAVNQALGVFPRTQDDFAQYGPEIIL